MNENPMVEQVIIALRRIVRSIDMHSQRMVKTCGLTMPQLVLMKEIARNGQRSPSELVHAAKLSHATITGILQRLEARGFVTRRCDENDRRRQIVVLTASGQEALDAAPDLLQDKLGSTLNGIKDWEQSLLLSSLQRLAEAMDAEELDAAPILSTGALTVDEDQVLEILTESAPEPKKT